MQVSPDLPPPRLLLVDDEPNILNSLRRLLRAEGYAMRTAEGGMQGLELLEQEPADVIISDMRMPMMSGAEFLKQARERWPDSVRILLTGFADMASTVSAVNEGGIHAYLNKPWDDVQLLHVVRGAVERKRLVDERNALLALTARQNEELTFLNDGLEDAVRARTAELRQSSNFLELSNKKLKESFLATLGVFSNLVELRHPHLDGHGKRVADLSRKIAKRLGMREQEINDITVAGLLHDIGKIGWTDDMIDKPFNVAFTIEERQLAMKHPAIAEKLLMELENMRGAARIVRHHHERFNGQGYPDGLSGLGIPIGARILAVVDDYDELQLGTLTQRRRSPVEAANMVKDGSGNRYDPSVVKIFLKIMGMAEAEVEVGPGQRIDSSELKPGKRLARDVIGEEESILLTKGHLLDDRLILQLRTYEEKVGHSLEIWISSA
jgi:response regulator RpfG family c-di-GMP phosphodiesterase